MDLLAFFGCGRAARSGESATLLKGSPSWRQVVQESGEHHSESNAEAELRRSWTEQVVSRERQNELISQIAAKAAPGARIGPFTVRDIHPNR